ncbi:MAG: hypothetical protein RRY95_06010 [Oscillospiraceae bacterium]
MDKRATGIVAYLTWIGLLIALLVGDREGAKFHLNQALVLWIAGLFAVIPCVGWIWGIFVFVCVVIGIIGAINDEERAVPFLGQFQLLK